MVNKMENVLMSTEKGKINYEIATIQYNVASQIAVVLSGTVFLK